MLDLHTHALPMMDDGARNIEKGIEMLSDAFSAGITKCALTSHCTIFMQEDIELFLTKREKCLEAFLPALEQNRDRIPEIILGAEVYATHDISRYEGLEKLCFEGTDFILLELPVSDSCDWLRDCINTIRSKGMNVVVAHLDRYEKWEEILRNLDGMNVIYQLNSTRFLNFRGKMLMKKILRHNEKFFISSDMHNMSTRKNTMKEAYDYVSKKYSDRAEDLFVNNARIVVG